MERLAVFEPGETGQGSTFHITLHPQGLSHIHRLVGEAAFVPRRLQGYTETEGIIEREREQEKENQISTATSQLSCEQYNIIPADGTV